MSNLKKVLALALVFSLVMSLGFASLAAGSDLYADWDDVGSDYQEAVEMLAYVDGGYYVLEGSNGNFNPTQTLTRAEFATLAARVYKGGAYKSGAKVDNAELFKANVNDKRFSDVPSSEWYAGPVNYAASIGLINGDASGTFRPDDTVKPIEMFKMLAVIVGMDKTMTVGASWEANIWNFLYDNDIDIYSLVASVEVTREEAAAALAATLKQDVLKVDRYGEYAPVDPKKTVLEKFFEKNFSNVGGVEVVGTLWKNSYGKISGEYDAFDGQVFIKVVDAQGVESLAIFNNVPDEGAPTALLGAQIALKGKKNSDGTYSYSGTPATLKDVKVNIAIGNSDASAYNTPAGADISKAVIINGGVGGGVSQASGSSLTSTNTTWQTYFAKTLATEAFAYRLSGKNAYNAIVRNVYTLGKITKITDDKITIGNQKGESTKEYKKTAIENAAGLAEGQFIAYYRVNDTDNVVWKPVETFTGVMTAFSGGKPTINGTTYSFLGMVIAGTTGTVGAPADNILTATELNTTGNLNADVTFYTFDGKLIGFKSNTVDPGKTYCILTAWQNYAAADALGNGGSVAKAQIVDQDGNQTVYTVNKLDDKSKGDIVDPTANLAVVGNLSGTAIYSFAKNSDGTIDLKTEKAAATGTQANGTSYVNGNTSFAQKAIDSGAVWFAYSSNNSKWTAFKGVGLFGNASTTYGFARYFLDNNLIKFGVVQSSDAFTQDSSNYLYVASDISYTVTDDGKIVASFKAFDVKNNKDLGTVNCVPGKQIDGSTNVGSGTSGAGIVKGNIVAYKVNADGQYTGKTQTVVDASASSLTSVADGTWVNMHVVNYLNGTFYAAADAYDSTKPASEANTGDFFYATSDTIIVDATGDTPNVTTVGNWKVTDTQASGNNYYMNALVQVKTGAGNPFPVSYIIITKGPSK